MDRHGDRQHLAGRPPHSGDRAARRVRLVLQGRERHPRDGRRQADRDDGQLGLREPGRSVIDFTPPMSHTLVPRQHPQEGRVREDDAGGPAAGQPRRHERRQLLRQHADHVHRRARRQAVQLLRAVGRAVPHDGVLVREHRAPAAVRAAGLLAGSVLLRPVLAARSTIRSLAPYIDARPGRGRAEPARRHRVRRSIPFNRYTRVELFGGYMHMSERYTNPDLQSLRRAVPGRPVRPARSSATAT